MKGVLTRMVCIFMMLCVAWALSEHQAESVEGLIILRDGSSAQLEELEVHGGHKRIEDTLAPVCSPTSEYVCCKDFLFCRNSTDLGEPAALCGCRLRGCCPYHHSLSGEEHKRIVNTNNALFQRTAETLKHNLTSVVDMKDLSAFAVATVIDEALASASSGVALGCVKIWPFGCCYFCADLDEAPSSVPESSAFGVCCKR